MPARDIPRDTINNTPRESLSARERRMARADRREREAPVAREAILRAAEEIFARDGFDGARVDAIAEASGYNKALIFHYFGDKFGLYREVVCMRRDQSEQQRTQMILAATGDPDTPLNAAHVRGFIETVVRWHFDHLVAHPSVQRIMAWEAAEGWGTLNEAKHGGGQSQLVWIGPIVAFVERAQAAGLIRPEIDPYLAVTHAKGMVLIHLLSIPNYEATFDGSDFSSGSALAHAREQLVSFAVHAYMTPDALTQTEAADAADGKDGAS
jgi:TetR/AcrR family transcriptional regulator